MKNIMTDRKFPDDFVPAEPIIDRGKLSISEIIEMAWDDETSFDQIKTQSGYTEQDVIRIMRENMKPSSFRMWRKRVSGRARKHESKMR